MNRTTEQRYEYALKIIMEGRDCLAVLSYEGMQKVAKGALNPLPEMEDVEVKCYRVLRLDGECSGTFSSFEIAHSRMVNGERIVEMIGTDRRPAKKKVLRREQISYYSAMVNMYNDNLPALRDIQPVPFGAKVYMEREE